MHTDWIQPSQPCPYCSGQWSPVYHTGVCPKVKAVEYYEGGMIKRVEFRPEGKGDKTAEEASQQ